MARPRAPSGPSGAVTGQTAKYNHGLIFIYCLPGRPGFVGRVEVGINLAGVTAPLPTKGSGKRRYRESPPLPVYHQQEC